MLGNVLEPNLGPAKFVNHKLKPSDTVRSIRIFESKRYDSSPFWYLDALELLNEKGETLLFAGKTSDNKEKLSGVREVALSENERWIGVQAKIPSDMYCVIMDI